MTVPADVPGTRVCANCKNRYPQHLDGCPICTPKMRASVQHIEAVAIVMFVLLVIAACSAYSGLSALGR